MSKVLILFVIAFVVFLIIDIFWIGFLAKDLYSNYLGDILADKFKIGPAIIFYIIYILALIYFVINPANSLKDVILGGLFFGLVCYATYDVTNYVTLKNFPVNIVIIDIIWGMVLTASTSTITYLIYMKIV